VVVDVIVIVDLDGDGDVNGFCTVLLGRIVAMLTKLLRQYCIRA
jgi:hypothetical protein